MPGDRGSAAAEFVLVGALLSVLTAAVIQIGIALYVRNIVHDAAVDGAYSSARADAAPGDAEDAVVSIVSATVGSDTVQSVAQRTAVIDGTRVSVVTVRATLPLVGLLGLPSAMEVTAHAPLETFAFE